MQKFAERRRYRLQFLIGFMVVAATAWCLCACTKEEAPPASPSVDVEMAETYPDAPDMASDADMAFAEIQDFGQECKSHRYLLPSGAYETLEFSQLLPSTQKERPTGFAVHSNALEDAGVEVSLDDVEYVSLNRPYRIWALDYSRYADDCQAKIARLRERDPRVRFETYPLQVITVNGQRIDLAYDYENGHIIIQRLGPWLTDKAVGQASMEAVIEQLSFLGANASGELTLRDKFLGRDITVPLVGDTRDEELTFLTCSVSVSTPDEGGIRDTRPRSVQFVPDTGSGRGIGVHVTSSWGRAPDPNALFFYIAGPAEYPECHEVDTF